MKGIHDIKNIVEIDSAWEEEYGMIGGVAVAEIIYPKRIAGVKAFNCYKNDVLRNHINLPIYNDNDEKDIHQDVFYLKKNELKKLQLLIVVKGMIIPPMFHNLNGIISCGLKCSVYEDKNASISKKADSHEDDPLAFCFKQITPLFDETNKISNANFTVVFGFSDIIQPGKIELQPVPSKDYNIYTPSVAWYMNDNFFPWEDASPESNKEFYC